MSQCFSKEKKNRGKRKADKEVGVPSWCMSWIFHRAHPAPAACSIPTDPKMPIEKPACRASAPVLMLTALADFFLDTAPLAISLQQALKGRAHGDKTKHIWASRVAACLWAQDVTILGASYDLLLLACSNISALLSQGCFPSLSQLCGSSLCSSAIPAPSLLPVWNAAQSKKINQNSKQSKLSS